LVVALSLPANSRADDLRTETSLGMVPVDAAFYASQMRMREQLDAFAASRFVGRIAELAGQPHAMVDSTQKWLDLVLAQMAAAAEADPSAAEFNEWLKAPENKELLDTVIDSLSNETFVYGGDGYTKWLQVYSEFNRRSVVEMRRAVEERGAEIDLSEGDFYGQIDLERAIPWEQVSSLELPETVIGFRVSDPARARRQFARLKPLVPLLEAQVPELAGRVKTVKIGDDELISIDLDGSLVDWEALKEQAKAEAEGGEVDPKLEAIGDRFIEILKTKKMNISFGVLGDYLLVSVAARGKHLESLGEGKSLLDQPDLAGMIKRASQGKLVAASYTANDFVRAGGDGKALLDQYLAMAEMWLVQADEIDDMMKLRLKRDARELATDLERLMPKPGGGARFVLWTERGYEGWLQSWQENLTYDAAQPLTITEHADGDPLVLLASRARYAPENYELLVKWIKKGDAYVNDFAIQDVEGRANYDKFKTEAGPFFARANKLISEMLLPALRDGQAALVIDAKLKSKLHPLVPTEEPLPVLQMALVWGVSDAALLTKAFVEGAGLVNSIAAKLHEIEPEQVPEWTLPRPQVSEVEGATLYSYPLPPEAGIDPQIAPVAAVSATVALATLSHDQAIRLLKARPLAVDGPLAQHAGKNAASASYVNFAGIVDALQPWIELAIRHGADLELPDLDDFDLPVPGLPGDAPLEGFEDEAAAEDSASVDEESEEVEPAATEPAYDAEQAIAYFRTSLDFVKCLRGYSSVTFAEGDSLVTHFEWRLEDLK
jgi:hypothetical protein